MRVIDNLAAIRLIWLLATPFEKFDAFKLGLIDANGNKLKKAKTAEEKNATSMLHRLVWNLKRIIALAPGGSSRIGSLVAAYLLVKEAHEQDMDESQLEELIVEKYHLYTKLRFIEEEVLVEHAINLLNEEGLVVGAPPVNNTAGPVAVDQPVIKQRKKSSLELKTKSGRSLMIPK